MTFVVSVDDLIAKDTSGLLSKHESWGRVRLGEVAAILNGYPFESNRFSREAGTPLLRIRDVLRGGTETFYEGDIPQEYLIESGDLLIGMDGDFHCALWRSEPALLNQRVCKVTTTVQCFDGSFLLHLLPAYLKKINTATPSITVKHLSSRTIQEINLPLPPLKEQRRVADKLDELFSDIDAGVVSLQRARANLKRYRAAVLKSAVEGRLTADWRARHPPSETGAELLARLLRERRLRWEEAQLAMFETIGKSPPTGWRSKYVEPTPPDTTALPLLPDGWCWASLSQVGFVDRGKSKHRPRNAPHLYDGPYPFIQTGDVRASDTFIRTWTQSYSAAGLAQSRLWPARTLCITIAANIAETGILDFEACFPDSVVGFLPGFDGVSVRYVELFIRTARDRLEAYAPATAQKNINLELLHQVAVPLPPSAEQCQIVDVLDTILTNTSRMDFDAENAIRRAASLRQAILKRAFSGRLVPQDPSDEPASVLLERIRVSRALAPVKLRKAIQPASSESPAASGKGSKPRGRPRKARI